MYKSVAVILVFISEIKRLLDYQDKYGVSWDSYQCFGYLILNSPNTKNLFLDIFIKMNLEKIQGKDQTMGEIFFELFLWPLILLCCRKTEFKVLRDAVELAKKEPIISSNWIINQIIYTPLIYIYFPSHILLSIYL